MTRTEVSFDAVLKIISPDQHDINTNSSYRDDIGIEFSAYGYLYPNSDKFVSYDTNPSESDREKGVSYGVFHLAKFNLSDKNQIIDFESNADIYYYNGMYRMNDGSCYLLVISAIRDDTIEPYYKVIKASFVKIHPPNPRYGITETREINLDAFTKATLKLSGCVLDRIGDSSSQPALDIAIDEMYDIIRDYKGLEEEE